MKLPEIKPNPEHPAFKKGRQSALRGVGRPRTKFPLGPGYRENVIQFRFGRASALEAGLQREVKKCLDETIGDVPSP